MACTCYKYAGNRAMAKKKPDEPKKKKLSIRERLHLIFNGVSKKELKGVVADTLKDLRDRKSTRLNSSHRP